MYYIYIYSFEYGSDNFVCIFICFLYRRQEKIIYHFCSRALGFQVCCHFNNNFLPLAVQRFEYYYPLLLENILATQIFSHHKAWCLETWDVSKERSAEPRHATASASQPCWSSHAKVSGALIYSVKWEFSWTHSASCFGVLDDSESSIERAAWAHEISIYPYRALIKKKKNIAPRMF